MSMRLQREVNELREEVARLRELVEQLMKAKKPGRPPKEKKAA